MSQDGRASSDKASPDRKDAPAENGAKKGENPKKASEGKSGGTQSGSQTTKETTPAPTKGGKKVEPTAAGASGGATAPTDKPAGAAEPGKPGGGESRPSAAPAAATPSGGARSATAKTEATSSSDDAKKAAEGGKAADEKPAAAKTAADKPATTTSAASKPAATAGRRRGGPRASGASGGLSAVVWTLVVVAVGAVVAIATLPRWQPAWNETVGQSQPALRIELGGDAGGEVLGQRLADVESRLGDLAALDQRSQQVSAELDKALARIAALEAGIREVREVAAQAAAQPVGGEANETLAQINRRLYALEGRTVSERDLEQSMQDVRGRLEELEQQTAQASSAATDDSQALVLAVAQLRDSVRRGVPYADDLETLRKIADADADIASSLSQLEGRADSGVPTLTALSRRFESIAGGMVAAQRSAGDTAWWQRAMDEVGSLVTLRRKDGAAAGAEGAVARAEELLDQGDLKAAVDVLESIGPELTPNAKKLLGPWLDDANARLAVERALATLHVRAISQLGELR